MRTHLALLSAVALAFGACQKPAAKIGADSEPAPATAEPTEPKAEKSKAATERSPLIEVPPAVTAAPAAPPRELAPAGRFYLRRKMSVETDSGIVGYPPGSMVTLTARDQYRTADGNLLTAIEADVTNDLAEVRQLVSADAAQQATHANAAGVAPTLPPLPAGSTAAATEPAATARARTITTSVPRHVDGVATSSPGGLQSSTAIGAQHSKTEDGIMWQKDPEGTRWVPVKWLSPSRANYALPPSRPVR